MEIYPPQENIYTKLRETIIISPDQLIFLLPLVSCNTGGNGEGGGGGKGGRGGFAELPGAWLERRITVRGYILQYIIYIYIKLKKKLKYILVIIREENRSWPFFLL